MRTTSIMEAPDNKLNARQRSVVKRVLDTTGGDLDAAIAVALTEMQKEGFTPSGDMPLLETPEYEDSFEDMYIDDVVDDIIEYLDIDDNIIEKARDGAPLMTFADICEAVTECYDLSPSDAAEAAYTVKQYLERKGWYIKDRPQRGSKADRKSRRRKSFFRFLDIEEESLSPRNRTSLDFDDDAIIADLKLYSL